MKEASESGRIVRFGVFEANLATGELRKGGVKIKLQEQPFQMLVMLLERPGEVVTREELRERLWPEDTFVDFDRSLNTAASRLREALGDDASNPRFIETLPRRGYRLIAPVTGAGAVSPTATRSPGPGLMAIGALVTALGLAAAGLYWRTRPGASEPEQVSTPVPLTTYPGSECSPSFSPDGNEVVFTWDGKAGDNHDIYRKLIGTGSPMRLTTGPAGDFAPAWSPDGRDIAFLRETGVGKSAVILIPALGGPERHLAEISVDADIYASPPAWSPDSKWLVVSDTVAGELPRSLFLLSVLSREKRRMTFPPATSLVGDLWPSFSPDGRSIVFVRVPSGGHLGDLHSLDVSERLQPVGNPKRLTNTNIQMRDPTWTEEGRGIVFASGVWPYSNSRLLRMPLSGPGEIRPLPWIGTGAIQPAVSTAGRRLVYAQLVLDQVIWRIKLPDGTRQPVVPEKLIYSTRQDVTPRWSPDGRRIAFRSLRSENPEIWVCNSDGSDPVQITSFGGPHVGWPAWSPDGKLLAFEGAGQGQRDVYVVRADGGAPRRVTKDPADDAAPSWSRDGRWIYFASSRSGDSQVWKIPVAGGEAVRVTKGGGRIAFESADGEHLHYSKTSALTSVGKVPVEGGEETRVLDSVRGASFAVSKSGIYFHRAMICPFSSSASPLARRRRSSTSGSDSRTSACPRMRSGSCARSWSKSAPT